MSEPEAVSPPAPPPRVPTGGWGVGRTAAVFLGVTVAFAALQIAHNRHLFAQPIHEEGDPATVSLLVMKAKRLELLHGHCSRLGFYHPGPGLIYALAGAEVVLHDLIGIVPAPHNAHMIGQLLLAAALILEVGAAVIARAASPAQLGPLLAPLRALALLSVMALVLERVAGIIALTIHASP